MYSSLRTVQKFALCFSLHASGNYIQQINNLHD